MSAAANTFAIFNVPVKTEPPPHLTQHDGGPPGTSSPQQMHSGAAVMGPHCPLVATNTGTRRDTIEVTRSGGVSRVFGASRKYMTKRKICERASPKTQKLVDIDSIVDGSAFPLIPTNDDVATCCLKHRCNEYWSAEEVMELRSEVPAIGEGGQAKRKIYAQNRVLESTDGRQHHLMLGSGWLWDEVCTNFFVSVTGISRYLINVAAKTGGPGRKLRTKTNSRADVITSWLRVISSRWEKQPDCGEIHMPFPNKRFVYNMFVLEEWASISGGSPPSYSYFVHIWKLKSSHIQLTRVSRSCFIPYTDVRPSRVGESHGRSEPTRRVFRLTVWVGHQHVRAGERFAGDSLVRYSPARYSLAGDSPARYSLAGDSPARYNPARYNPARYSPAGDNGRVFRRADDGRDGVGSGNFGGSSKRRR